MAEDQTLVTHPVFPFSCLDSQASSVDGQQSFIILTSTAPKSRNHAARNQRGKQKYEEEVE